MTLTRLDGLVVTVGVDPACEGTGSRRANPPLSTLSPAGAVKGQVLRIDGALNPKTRQVDADISVPPPALGDLRRSVPRRSPSASSPAGSCRTTPC